MTTIVVTPEEIADFRSELANYPDASFREEALKELEVVEKCIGDLERATRVLARRAQEPILKADSPFENLLEKAREILCKPEHMEKLAKANEPLIVLQSVAALLSAPYLPEVIITLILLKKGVEYLCKSDDSDNSDN